MAELTDRDVVVRAIAQEMARDPDPVVVFEHKSLYAVTGEVPDGEIVDTPGTARIVRPVRDVPMLVLSPMVPRALPTPSRIVETIRPALGR